MPSWYMEITNLIMDFDSEPVFSFFVHFAFSKSLNAHKVQARPKKQACLAALNNRGDIYSSWDLSTHGLDGPSLPPQQPLPWPTTRHPATMDSGSQRLLFLVLVTQQVKSQDLAIDNGLNEQQGHVLPSTSRYGNSIIDDLDLGNTIHDCSKYT